MAQNARQRIARIWKQMTELGAIHPGRLTQQYNICGRPDCCCKDKENPRRHGPYWYISYTLRKKSRTIFVAEEHVDEMRRRTERFVQMKDLVQQLIEASIDLAQEEGLRKTRSS